MASANTEQSAHTNQNDHSQSNGLNHGIVSSVRSSSPQSVKRRRSISFAEDDFQQPSTSAYDHRQTTEADSAADEAAAAKVQDHDRDLSGPIHNTTAVQSDPNAPPSKSSCQDQKEPWYSRLASSYQSISLENKGSVARDHLALERTFLAWLRTSLAFASIGIAITQLFRLNTSLADQKEQMRWILRHWNISNSLNSHENDNDDKKYLPTGPEKRGSSSPSSLPLSPLMGASLTPDIYSHIQSVLEQRQMHPFVPPSPFSPNPDAPLHQFLFESNQFNSDAAARLRHMGKPLGATFLGISIVILSIGFHRYFESQHWIIRGKFPASRGSVALTGLIAGALIVTSLVVVLVVAPAAYSTPN